MSRSHPASSLFSAMSIAGQQLSITVGDTTRNVVLPLAGGIGGSAALSDLVLSADGTEATGLFEVSIKPTGEGYQGVHVEVAENIDWENLSDYTFETYPPFSTNSTALCNNVNADLIDGLHAAELLQAVSVDGSDLSIKVGGTTKKVKIPSSSSAAAVNTDTTIVSTAPSGTMPIAVNSITVCNNLNADLLDGWHAANIFQRLTISGSTLTAQIAGVTKSVTLPTSSAGSDAVIIDSSGVYPSVDFTGVCGTLDRRWNLVSDRKSVV